MANQSRILTITGQDLRTAAPPPSTLDLMVLWTQAYDLWLQSRLSTNTRRAYRLAWEKDISFFICEASGTK